MAVKQTAGRDQLGTFAPKVAELNDDGSVRYGAGRSSSPSGTVLLSLLWH